MFPEGKATQGKVSACWFVWMTRVNGYPHSALWEGKRRDLSMLIIRYFRKCFWGSIHLAGESMDGGCARCRVVHRSFLKFCCPHRPQLMLLDSHCSHETLCLIETARDNNITLLTFPSHYLCPLDRTIPPPFCRIQSCLSLFYVHITE